MFEERGEKGDKSIKSAFEKVKLDIFTLGNEISSIKTDISDLKNQISSLILSLDNLKIQQITSNYPKNLDNDPKDPYNFPTHYPTDTKITPTHYQTPTDTPTLPLEVGGSKYPNFDTWSGNVGVPTDRQTNQQTDNPTDFIEGDDYLIQNDNSPENDSFRHYKQEPVIQTEQTKPLFSQPKSLNQHIKEASHIIDSLDGIKKEIRLKFKSMTQQEMTVFSTIYQLEQQYPEGVEYKHIATLLKLSESSIRDYTLKLISKGIPVEKLKLNNKKILLRISPELKNIAPLATLLKLREL